VGGGKGGEEREGNIERDKERKGGEEESERES